MSCGRCLVQSRRLALPNEWILSNLFIHLLRLESGDAGRLLDDGCGLFDLWLSLRINGLENSKGTLIGVNRYFRGKTYQRTARVGEIFRGFFLFLRNNTLLFLWNSNLLFLWQRFLFWLGFLIFERIRCLFLSILSQELDLLELIDRKFSFHTRGQGLCFLWPFARRLFWTISGRTYIEHLFCLLLGFFLFKLNTTLLDETTAELSLELLDGILPFFIFSPSVLEGSEVLDSCLQVSLKLLFFQTIDSPLRIDGDRLLDSLLDFLCDSNFDLNVLAFIACWNQNGG
jgi:hypothetical protein